MPLFQMSLFHERSGAFSPEKTGSLVLTVLPALWLAAWAINGDLGGRPITAALHVAGDWAVRFLVLSLAVTPARRAFAWPKLFFARRILGLAALAYALLHVGLYVVDQGPLQAAREIVLRVYLTIGAVAVVLLLALGATSYDAAIRRLGATRWNALHASVYLIAVLAVLHFFIQSKLDVTEPVLMAGALLFLFAYRLAWRFAGEVMPLGLAALAVLAALATAGVEVAWYAAATRVDPLLVAQANLSFDLGLRPSWWVLLGGLAFAALAFLRARAKPARRARTKAAVARS